MYGAALAAFYFCTPLPLLPPLACLSSLLSGTLSTFSDLDPLNQHQKFALNVCILVFAVEVDFFFLVF